MQTVVLTIHVLLAIALIGLVLMQQGKGADAGAAFGSGSSATVFGAGGSGSFLTRVTTALAVAFFATSIGLAVMAANRGTESDSVVDTVVPGESGNGAATETVDGQDGATQSGSSDLPAQSGSDGSSSQSGDDMPPIEE